MKLENFHSCQECYEKVYGVKLKYTTKKELWNKNFDEYNQFITDLTKQKQTIKPSVATNAKKASKSAKSKISAKSATKKPIKK